MKNKFKITLISIIFIALTITTGKYFHFLKSKEKTLNISSISNKQEKIAYLTFDDGPSNNTEKILEILDKYNIKATFFVVGPKTTYKDDLLKRMEVAVLEN